MDLTKQSGSSILDLLVAFDELLLKELSKHAQNHLIENQSTWVQINLVIVLNKVFKIASCKQLRDHCLEIFCQDPLPFLTTKDFLSLNKEILYELLKREDLQIKEVVVWDHLIKWVSIKLLDLKVR